MPKPARANVQAKGGVRLKEYVIRPVPLSTGPRDKGTWTYRLDYGQPSANGNYVWYIEGSEPKVLVDSGVGIELYAARGLNQQAVQSLEEGLARLGLKPEDIGIVIQTHLHWDHVGLAYKFAKAKFVVQKAELDYALNPHQVFRDSYDRKMLENLDFEVIEGDKEILEGIRVIFTPGHTPGGQSVVINVRGGTAIITGLCCIQDNFEPPPELMAKGFEVVIPGIHINTEQAYDSMLKVKKAADIIIPIHEVALKDRDRIP